jgi:hypothetical protein
VCVHTHIKRAHTHFLSLIHINRIATYLFFAWRCWGSRPRAALRLRALVLCACLDALHVGRGGVGAAHAGGPLWLRVRGGGGEGGLLAQRLAGDELREQAEERARRSELRKKRAERKARRRRRVLEVGIQRRRRASVPP